MMRTARFSLLLTFLGLLLAACASPPSYPRNETLNALESRLTRPTAGVDQVEYYLTLVQQQSTLQRAENFFQTLAEEHPDRPLFRYGWGRALRLQSKPVPARVRYLEVLDLLEREDLP